MSTGPKRGRCKSALLAVGAVGATAALLIVAHGRTRAQLAPASSRPAIDALTPALVARCAAFPGGLVATPPAAMFQVPASRATLLDARAFAAGTQPTLDLLTTLLYRGPSPVEQTIDSWLTRDGAAEAAIGEEDGGPRPDEVQAAPRTLREPSSARLEVAPGRLARVGSVGMGLGGTMLWATLPSPDGRYDLTLVVTAYASDYSFTQAERDATRSWTQSSALSKLLTCLDAALWSRGGH